ncbi:MAG: hypothetical protein WDM78_24170 [Puia sp.]
MCAVCFISIGIRLVNSIEGPTCSKALQRIPALISIFSVACQSSCRYTAASRAYFMLELLGVNTIESWWPVRIFGVNV